LRGPVEKSAHILVVEDDQAFRQLAGRMLERAGFRVTLAADYVDALKKVETDGSIGMLLMDIGMPPGTPHGIAIAKMSQLRQVRLKVVYMTGSDAAEQAQYTEGVPVLQKPFTSEQLIATVRLVLGN
jgi:two-component system cell cycle sensor histidine kinase/response regulator CckA